MIKKNDSQNHHTRKENDNRRMRDTQRNSKEQYIRKRDNLSTGETRRINIRRRWSGVHERKNLCTE